MYVYTAGIESLCGIIPKSLLPEDYGGELPSMNILSGTIFFTKRIHMCFYQ